MTRKETGSIDGDWSEVSGRGEESGAGAGSEEVPPWAEALARADPESHPTGEMMDAGEGPEANMAEDGSEDSEQLDGEEGDGKVAGNTIAIAAFEASTEDEDTSGLAGSKETEETASGKATGRAKDGDGNEASLAPAAGVASADLTDDGIDVNADVVGNDAMLARAAELIGSALFQSDMSAPSPSATAEDVKSVSSSSSSGSSSSNSSSVPPVEIISAGNGGTPPMAETATEGEAKGEENMVDEGKGAAPKNSTAPNQNVEKIMWFWRTDGGSWEPYDDADAARLERARSSGDETAFLSDASGAPKYECHLGRMRQQNLRTNRTRGMCRGWPDPQRPSVEPCVEPAGSDVSVKDKSVSGHEDEINLDADAAPATDAPPGTVSSDGSEASGAEDRDEAEESHWTKLSVEEFDVPPLTDWTRAMLFAGNDETPDETSGLSIDNAAEKEGEEGSEEVATKDAAARVVENLAAFVGHKDSADAAASSIPKNEYGVTTPMFGGGGGGPFDDSTRPYVRISGIAVNAGALIDGISVTYSDGATTKHGGEGGGWHYFPLVGGEGVVEARVRYGRFVQSLEFRTNRGRTFGPFGEGGFVLGLGRLAEATIEAPEGHILVGVHGRKGKYIDGIGFHWAPEWWGKETPKGGKTSA